jgi:hypothetical protein
MAKEASDLNERIKELAELWLLNPMAVPDGVEIVVKQPSDDHAPALREAAMFEAAAKWILGSFFEEYEVVIFMGEVWPVLVRQRK